VTKEKKKLLIEFFEPWRIPIYKKVGRKIHPTFCISYIHQPYCWQVALQQSLIPLGADTLKIKKVLSIDMIKHHRR